MSARPPPRAAPPPRALDTHGAAPSADDSAQTILREGPSPAPPPGSTTTGPSIASYHRVTRNAVLSLAAFSGLTAVGLGAWLARADAPWGLPAVIALLSMIGGVATAALLWRRPQQRSAYAALGVLGLSVLRVGLPAEWTWASVALLTLTAVLAVPVVQAAMVLPRS